MNHFKPLGSNHGDSEPALLLMLWFWGKKKAGQFCESWGPRGATLLWCCTWVLTFFLYQTKTNLMRHAMSLFKRSSEFQIPNSNSSEQEKREQEGTTNCPYRAWIKQIGTVSLHKLQSWQWIFFLLSCLSFLYRSSSSQTETIQKTLRHRTRDKWLDRHMNKDMSRAYWTAQRID